MNVFCQDILLTKNFNEYNIEFIITQEIKISHFLLLFYENVRNSEWLGMRGNRKTNLINQLYDSNLNFKGNLPTQTIKN